MISQILLLIIQFVHTLIVFFALFGCFLPLNYIKYHLFMFPIIYIQWKLNNNRCILTDIECVFLHTSQKPLWENIQTYINTYNINNDQITIIFLVILITGFIISSLRLYNAYTKK